MLVVIRASRFGVYFYEPNFRMKEKNNVASSRERMARDLKIMTLGKS